MSDNARSESTRTSRGITFSIENIDPEGVSSDEVIRRMTGLNDIDIARLNQGLKTCEYNPAAKRAAYTNGDPGACNRVAEVSVGYNGKWHLCRECASLPEFSRYRSVHPL